jgi:hypothetical protein
LDFVDLFSGRSNHGDYILPTIEDPGESISVFELSGEGQSPRTFEDVPEPDVRDARSMSDDYDFDAFINTLD